MGIAIKQIVGLVSALARKLDFSLFTESDQLISSNVSAQPVVLTAVGNSVIAKQGTNALAALTMPQFKSMLGLTSSDISVGTGRLIIGNSSNEGSEFAPYQIGLAGFSLSLNTLPLGNNLAIAVETPVSTIPLSLLGPPNSDLNINNHKVINISSPVNTGDAVNLSYIQTTFAGVFRLRGKVTDINGTTQYDTLGGYVTALQPGDVFSINVNGPVIANSFLSTYGLPVGQNLSIGNNILFDGTQFGLIGANVSISGVNVPTALSQLTDDVGYITAAKTFTSGDLTGSISQPTVVAMQGETIHLTSVSSGQILYYNGTAWINSSPPAGPVTLYGDVVGSGVGTIAITLAASGVTAGTYSNIVTNVKGQLTNARAINSADVSVALGYMPYDGANNALGFVGQNSQMHVTGDVTGVGSTVMTLVLSATGITAGTYSNTSVDSKGRVLSIRPINTTDITTALGYTPFNAGANTAFLTANQSITVYGDAVGVGSTSVSLALNIQSGMTAAIGTANSGLFNTFGQFTISNKGVVLTARNLNNTDINIALGYTAYNGAANPLSFIGAGSPIVVSGDATGTGTTSLALTLVNQAGVTAGFTGGATTSGTFSNFVVSSKGVITGAQQLNSGHISVALGYTPYNAIQNPSGFISANQNIVIAGDVTGSGNTAVTLTLATTGVIAGTYNNITVNPKGQVTGARALNVTDITVALGYTPFNPGSNSSFLTANQSITLTGDIIGVGNTSISVALVTTGVTAGTYTNFIFNAKGQATGARQLAATDITNVLGFQPGTLNTNQSILLSGDVTGVGNTSIAVTLVTTGVTAGTYGNIVVNPKGQLTSIRALQGSDIPAINTTQISNIGSIATQNVTAISITGGSIYNITFSGGTF